MPLELLWYPNNIIRNLRIGYSYWKLLHYFTSLRPEAGRWKVLYWTCKWSFPMYCMHTWEGHRVCERNKAISSSPNQHSMKPVSLDFLGTHKNYSEMPFLTHEIGKILKSDDTFCWGSSGRKQAIIHGCKIQPFYGEIWKYVTKVYMHLPFK